MHVDTCLTCTLQGIQHGSASTLSTNGSCSWCRTAEMSSSLVREVTKLNHSHPHLLTHSWERERVRERESTPAVSHNSTNPLLASLPPSAPSSAKDQSVYFFMNVWIRWKRRSIGCGFGFQDLTCYSTCTHTNSLSHSHATSQMDWNN